MSGIDQCLLFRVERYPFLGDLKCISFMGKLIGGSISSILQRLSTFQRVRD